MQKIVSKLRTTQDTFCEINCRVMTTWRVDGWRKKKKLQSALIKLLNNVQRILVIAGRGDLRRKARYSVDS